MCYNEFGGMICAVGVFAVPGRCFTALGYALRDRARHIKCEVRRRTLGKMLKVLEGDGEILDRGEWQRFLAAGEKKLDELIEADPE